MRGRPNVFGLSRDLWDHPLFAAEPYTEREAWAWLIGAAAWKTFLARGNVGLVKLERGEFSFAIRFLAEKWRWDKSRVHRFIARLIKNEMLQKTNRDANQVYFICNYNRFQVVGVPKRDANETDARREQDSGETPMGQRRDKEETGETGQTVKQEIEESRAPQASPPKLPVSRGIRWGLDQKVPEDWFADVITQCRALGREPPNLRLEAAKFENFWASKSGKDATKTDWKKTFINWCLNARTDKHNSFSKPGFDALREGARRAAGLDYRSGQGVEAAPDNLLRLARTAGNAGGS